MDFNHERELLAVHRQLFRGQLVSSKYANTGNNTDDFRTISLSRTICSPIEAVWAACTKPDLIAKWFAPVTGTFEVDGRYQVKGNAGGTIVDCEPTSGFTLTWEFGQEISHVRLSFNSLNDSSSTVHLDHAFAVNNHWKQYGPGAGGVGWDMAFLGLKLHLAGDFVPKDETWWSVDEAAISFLKGSSEAWCRAAVSAGEDEEWANKAREQTTKFYAPSAAEP